VPCKAGKLRFHWYLLFVSTLTCSLALNRRHAAPAGVLPGLPRPGAASSRGDRQEEPKTLLACTRSGEHGKSAKWALHFTGETGPACRRLAPCSTFKEEMGSGCKDAISFTFRVDALPGLG